MYCRLDISTSEEGQRITGINRQTCIQRFCPFPITRLVVFDLQRSYRLSEQQGDGAQIRMTL